VRVLKSFNKTKYEVLKLYAWVYDISFLFLRQFYVTIHKNVTIIVNKNIA